MCIRDSIYLTNSIKNWTQSKPLCRNFQSATVQFFGTVLDILCVLQNFFSNSFITLRWDELWSQVYYWVYVSPNKDVKTKPNTIDIVALIQRKVKRKVKMKRKLLFWKNENVKSYQNAVKSCKKLQQFGLGWNTLEMLSMIYHVKVFEECWAANCVQKTYLEH